MVAQVRDPRDGYMGRLPSDGTMPNKNLFLFVSVVGHTGGVEYDCC